MGKGEIARYEQFLLFPQCFQKACFPEVSNGVILWEWDNPFNSDRAKILLLGIIDFTAFFLSIFSFPLKVCPAEVAQW